MAPVVHQQLTITPLSIEALLLRRYKDQPHASLIFIEDNERYLTEADRFFESTSRIFSTKDLISTTISPDRFSYWHSHTTSIRSSQCKLYTALLFRIDSADSLRANLKQRCDLEAQIYDAHLTSYINAHLPLARYIHKHRIYKDTALRPKIYELYKGVVQTRYRFHDEDYDTPYVDSPPELTVPVHKQLQQQYPDENIFHEFSDYLATIKSKLMNVKNAEEALIQLCGEKPSFLLHNEDVAGIENHHPMLCSIYYACIIRMNRARQLYEQLDNSKLQSELALLLHRFVCSHLALLHYIIESGNCCDRNLENDANPNGHTVIPFELFYPHSGSAFWCGDLPNLGDMLPSFGFWWTDARMRGDNSCFHGMSKCMPFKCQCRCLSSAIVNYCKENETFWRFIRAIFQCSIMGMYEKVSVRPNFPALLRIYHWLYDENGCKRAVLDLFMEDQELLRYVMREYVLYMLQFDPALYTITNYNPIDWQQCRSVTTKIMDTARQVYNKTGSFNGMAPQLKKLSKSCGQNVYRLRRHSLIPTLLEHCHHIFEDIYICQLGFQYCHQRIPNCIQLLKEQLQLRSNCSFSQLNENTQWALKDILFTTEEDSAVSVILEQLEMMMQKGSEWLKKIEAATADVSDSVIQNIWNYVLRIDTSQAINFGVLEDERLGGMSNDGINKINVIIQYYLYGYSPTEIINQISEMRARDLQILRKFLIILSKIAKIQLIPLDVKTMEDIDTAMRNVRYSLFPGEKLPDRVYDIYYLPCCERIATFTSSNSYGNRFLTYNPKTKRLECKRKTGEARSKYHAPKTPFSFDLKDTDQKKIARSHRKTSSTFSCHEMPALRIRLKGYCLIEGIHGGLQKKYLHCPKCGAFHQQKMEGFGPGGYMCETCAEKHLCRQVLIRCAYCNETKKDNQNFTAYDVFDDFQKNPANAYRILYLCPTHDKFFQSNGKYGLLTHDTSVLFKSKMWKVIHERAMKMSHSSSHLSKSTTKTRRNKKL